MTKLYGKKKINILNKDSITIPDLFLASGFNMAHHKTVFMSDFDTLFMIFCINFDVLTCCIKIVFFCIPESGFIFFLVWFLLKCHPQVHRSALHWLHPIRRGGALLLLRVLGTGGPGSGTRHSASNENPLPVLLMGHIRSSSFIPSMEVLE